MSRRFRSILLGLISSSIFILRPVRVSTSMLESLIFCVDKAADTRIQKLQLLVIRLHTSLLWWSSTSTSQPIDFISLLLPVENLLRMQGWLYLQKVHILGLSNISVESQRRPLCCARKRLVFYWPWFLQWKPIKKYLRLRMQTFCLSLLQAVRLVWEHS